MPLTSRGAVAWAVCCLLATSSGCGGEGVPLGSTLTLAVEGASNPTTAVDESSGVALVAWVDTRGNESHVLLTRVTPDGSVEEPVRVNHVPGDAAAHYQAPAQVAAGPSGEVYVLWTNNTPIEGRRFPASDLRFARSSDGGRSFEPTITVNDDAGGPPTSHTFHDLLVAPDGTIYVSWLDSRRNEASVRAEAHGMEVEQRFTPQAVEGARQGHAGHMGSGPVPPEESGPDLRLAVSRDGGRTFEPELIVNQSTCPCCRTAIAMGPHGELYVAWREVYPGDIRDVVVARSDDSGATWSEPMKVHDDGWVFPGCPHAGPALDVDENGDLHVVWYTGKEGASGLFYARSHDRGWRFTDPVPLVTAAAVPPSLSSLVAEEGGVWVSWENRRNGPPEVHTVRTSYVGMEQGPDPDVIPGSHPSAASRGGTRVLAWLAGESVLARVGRTDP